MFHLEMAGVPIGTILAFMMSVTALSLPSIIMLSKVVKPKLLCIFVGIVTIGIVITGYLFNSFNFLLYTKHLQRSLIYHKYF